MTSRNISYRTPEWLYKLLIEEYQITIDGCATQGNAVCQRFWNPEQDGLRQPWVGEIPFWNPPFDDTAAWVRKAYNEAKDNGVTSVGLVPFRKDQYWFNFALENAQLRLVQGGFLYFAGFDEQAGQVARIDAVIFIFGPDYPGHTTGALIVPPWKPDTAKYQVSGIRTFAPMLTKPAGVIVVRSYADLLPYIIAFSEGIFNFLVLLGHPGLSKSTLIRTHMPESSCWIRGTASPFKVYVNLYKAVNLPVIADDVEPLLRKPSGVDLLKQLCENDDIKTLTWETDAALLKKEKIPNEFPTASKVCLIANDWAKLVSILALEDRGIILSFEPDAAEVHKQVGTEGWFDDKDIYDFIGAHLHLIMRPSMRTYVKAQEIKKGRQRTRSRAMDWRRYLLTQWLRDEKLIEAAKLLADKSFPSNRARARAFESQGWGSQSTFYAKARELRNSSPNGVLQDSSGSDIVPQDGPPAK
jgi:hypothetical protein